MYKQDAASPSSPPVCTAYVLEVASGKVSASYAVGFHAVALSPDGKRLAVGEAVDYSERPARMHVWFSRR